MRTNKIIPCYTMIFCLLLAFQSTARADDEEVTVSAYDSNAKAVQMLEEVETRSLGTPNEHDILLRLLDTLAQTDHLVRLKEGGSTSGAMSFSKKIDQYSARFLSLFPKDEVIYHVHAIRAVAHEEQGNRTAMIQDEESVLQTAPQKSEDRLKAEIKLGEAYRQQSEFAKSQKVLQQAIDESSDKDSDYKKFAIESLLQTDLQGRFFEDALWSVTQLLKDPHPSDQIFQKKGQILARLVAMGKLSIDRCFAEAVNYTPEQKSLMWKTLLSELTTLNHPEQIAEFISHPKFLADASDLRLDILSSVAVNLSEQGITASVIQVLQVATDIIPLHPEKLTDVVARWVDLSRRVEKEVAKNPALSHQNPGKTLELLYALIEKDGQKGNSALADVQYNKAALLMVEGKPNLAFPMFKVLNDFKDAQEKYFDAFDAALKGSKTIPEEWTFVAPTVASDPEQVKDLKDVSKKTCSEKSFSSALCFDFLKGLMKLGENDFVNDFLRQVIFRETALAEDRSHAFSVLFDEYQFRNQTADATALVAEIRNKKVPVNTSVVSDAARSMRIQKIKETSALFEAKKDLEVVSAVQSAVSNGTAFPELFAYGALAAQRLGQDANAAEFYHQYDLAIPKGATVPTGTGFSDLVSVGHALYAERSFNFQKSCQWWGKVKVWTNTDQKKLGLNDCWLAADVAQIRKLIEVTDFCGVKDASLCTEYERLTVLTWPSVAANFPQLAAQHSTSDVTSEMYTLLIATESRHTDLKAALDIHEHWKTLEPVRQVALFPTFQSLLKFAVQDWVHRQFTRMNAVNHLMDFQVALKDMTGATADLNFLSTSAWTDFQVQQNVAVALAYDYAMDALNRAKGQDHATLDQDPSVKQIIDQTLQQLRVKRDENNKRALSLTQNFSLDMSGFDDLTVRFPEWVAIEKTPVKTSPASFYSAMTGRAKDLKDQWLLAFHAKNWAKVGAVLVQMSHESVFPQKIYSTFEAETYLRFGNRIDAQRTIASVNENGGSK